ncbi:MAG: arginase family protein [Candidatus Heimdallarchaeota archaeon]
MKNLDFVLHEPDMLCGIIKREWNADDSNYHLLGVPLDISSTYRTGSRYGPEYLRRVFTSENFECTTEQGIDLIQHFRIKDWGNVGIIPSNIEKSLKFVSEGVQDLLGTKQPFLIVGGDHSITIGIGEAFERAKFPFYSIYIDAHLDLYSEMKGSKLSHACTLRRLSEMEFFRGATVLGCRDFTFAQLEYAKTADITPISLIKLLQEEHLFQYGYELAQSLISKENRIHISLDLDVLDPSCAPGVNNPVAGGMGTRQLIELLTGIFQGLSKPRAVSWDIVELNPLYDQAEITAFTVVKIMLEGLGAQVEI